jgi:hypothetical protein
MGQPEAHPKAMEVEADAVEPVPDIPEVIEEEPIAVHTDAIPDNYADAIASGWIGHGEMVYRLKNQGIKDISIRTLQDWAKKYQGTKEGFSPRYIARKFNHKWLWKPA